MNSEDYYEVYRCGNCKGGYLGKTKDNTPGHKFSSEYLCKYCGVNTKKGELVIQEQGSDMMPSKYLVHMKMVTGQDEYLTWQKIWFD